MAEPEITLTLPIPPSTNLYWRYGKGGNVRVSTKAKIYKETVFWTLRDNGIEPIVGPVAINISIFRPRRAGDLDNYLKVLLDSLEGHLFENDKQVVEIHAFRYDDKADPRVEIVAWSAKNH